MDKPVASISYNFSGARKTSTDPTAQPFSYNGETRDDTGLDYLRARYYDSQGGAFLTEDSYPGEVTDPLSQNRYSYVQNNPVNYTDPSGHRMVWMGGEGEPSRPRSINTRLQRFYQRSIVEEDSLGRAVSLHEYTDRRIRTDRNFRAPASYYQAFGPNVATYQGGSYGGQSSYAYAQQQAARARAQAEQRRRQQIRYEYGLATGIKSSPTIREGLNLLRNWGTALQNTLKHVCNPKTTGASDKGEIKVPSVADFRKYEDAARYGLTVSEKANIDSSSLSELKNKYGNVLGNYNTYQGTGYFNPQGSPRNRYIISRYEELKAIEDAKVAQKVAEMNKYHYTNLYKHIAETGYRIDGTPASDLEKTVAPYVPWIAPIQDVAAAVAGRQVAKYNSSVPTGNGMKWGAEKSTKAVDKASDAARVAGKVDDVKDGTRALTSQEIADKFVSGMEDISKKTGTKNFQSYGGYEKALEDFNSLPLENIKVINTSFGKGYVGILSDGTKVVVRPGSTSNRGATLEFQLEQSKAFEGGSTYEIRYGD